MIGSKSSENVGDPFKDTSGPSMNIMIKLSKIVALIIDPHIVRKAKIKNIGTNNTEVNYYEKR